MPQVQHETMLERLFPQSALDAIPQPIYVYRPDGFVAGCNVAAEKFWRLPKEHMVGLFNLFNYDHRDEGGVVRAVRAALNEGKVEVTAPTLIDVSKVEEVSALSKAQAHVESTVFPLRDAEGTIHYAVVLQRDVSELVEKRQAVEKAVEKIAFQREMIESFEAAQREISEQRLMIQELSTPIIQVWESVLTLPVIGAVDEKRATEMMHKLLEEIVQTQAEFAILDLTGVRSMDTATADHLHRILSAVTLLGARGIVAGVSPEVAQTLTSIGVNMSMVDTCRNLRDALMRCMKAREQALSRKPRQTS